MNQNRLEGRVIKYSVVVPIYNEEKSIEELYEEILNVMGVLQEPYEIIFVNDGSIDQSGDVIGRLHDSDSRVKAIKFRRNHGKSAAYSDGFLAAQGNVVITLDSDLQDDPNEIPKLLDALNSGYDLIVGWKENRLHNEPSRKIFSWFFNKMVQFLFRVNLHDSNSGFRVMKREVARSLDLYGDHYRFIPEIAHSKGYRVKEIGVVHRRRKHGRSKYGSSRYWTGLLDILTIRFLSGFTYKPLHFFGTLSLFPLSIGVGLEVYVLIKKLSGGKFSSHVAAMIIGVLMLLVGIQLIATGLLGEMISRHDKKEVAK